VARILIVDNHVLVRRLLWQILTDARHEVVGEAEVGIGAVTRFSDLTPDLVALGLGPSGVDELVTLRGMLALAPSVPVVMCTGASDQEIAREAVRIGARGYIVKPFSRDVVLGAVRHALRPPVMLDASVSQLRPPGR
jgi:two-component system, chemotaxis family, chemotaxis protein CheY